MGLKAKQGQALTLTKSWLSKDVSDQYFSGYKRHISHVSQKKLHIIGCYILHLRTAMYSIEK